MKTGGRVWAARELEGFSWCFLFEGTSMISRPRRSFSLQTLHPLHPHPLLFLAVKPLKHWVIAPRMMKHKTRLPDWSAIVAIAIQERAREREWWNLKFLEVDTVNSISAAEAPVCQRCCSKCTWIPLCVCVKYRAAEHCGIHLIMAGMARSTSQFGNHFCTEFACDLDGWWRWWQVI